MARWLNGSGGCRRFPSDSTHDYSFSLRVGGPTRVGVRLVTRSHLFSFHSALPRYSRPSNGRDGLRRIWNDFLIPLLLCRSAASRPSACLDAASLCHVGSNGVALR